MTEIGSDQPATDVGERPATLPGAWLAGREGRRDHPALRAFVRAPGGIVGAVIFAALVVLAIVGPVIFGDQARKTDLSVAYQSPLGPAPAGHRQPRAATSWPARWPRPG